MTQAPDARKPSLGLNAVVLVALLLGLMGGASNAFAEFNGVKVKVAGLSCPFCACGLEKKLSKVAGVSSVSTNLKSGTVHLSLTKGANVSARGLSEAVRQAGFTLESVTVTAVGALKVEDGRLLLSVRDVRQEFLLFEASAREEETHSGKQPKLPGDVLESALRELSRKGAVVAVTGRIHDHAEGPAGLLVEKYEVVK